MIKLYRGDCLDIMPSLSDKSIDMILADLPYGTTQCTWDSIIDLDKLWPEYLRLIKDSGAIVLFGAEPFSSVLRMSNLKMYKYDWIWRKDKATGHLNVKRQPMRETERISVFYRKQCRYLPQLRDKPKGNIRPPTKYRRNIDNYGKMDKESERTIPVDKSYPVEILNFRGCYGDKGKSNHPTEKPVNLLEYLIKTYSIEVETIFDNTMGSGSTGVACVNLNRNFIGIEKEKQYFDIAIKRITEAGGQGIEVIETC